MLPQTDLISQPTVKNEFIASIGECRSFRAMHFPDGLNKHIFPGALAICNVDRGSKDYDPNSISISLKPIETYGQFHLFYPQKYLKVTGELFPNKDSLLSVIEIALEFGIPFYGLENPELFDKLYLNLISRI